MALTIQQWKARYGKRAWRQLNNDLRGGLNNTFKKTIRIIEQEKKAKRAKKKKGRRDEIKRLAALPYEEYLQTGWWKRRRKKALRRARFHCTRCEQTRELQVHHLSYARLGCEKDEDLIVLCDECHQSEHGDDPRLIFKHMAESGAFS